MFIDIIKCKRLLYHLYKLHFTESLRNAINVRTSAKACGSIGIKLLQTLVQRNEFISSDYRYVFDEVFEDCDTHSWTDTVKLYRFSFGRSIYDDYDVKGYDTQPVGSGSIGQVYKLYHKKLKRYVALKVKHPNIESKTRKFVFATMLMLRLVNSIVRLPFYMLIKEFMENVSLQLDYNMESKNTMRLRVHFKNEKHIIVPRVYEHNNHIIVMDYHDGVSYKHITNEGLHFKISVDMFLFIHTSILLYDCFHCDLHQGNWKVQPLPDGNYNIVIYDCGIMSSTNNLELNRSIIKCFLDEDLRSLTKVCCENKDDKKTQLLEEYYVNHVNPSDGINGFRKILKQALIIGIKINPNIIRMVQGIAAFDTCFSKGINRFSKLWNGANTNSSPSNIRMCVYHGLARHLNKYSDLQNYYSQVINSDPEIKIAFNAWLDDSFGHTDASAFFEVFDKIFQMEGSNDVSVTHV